MGIEDSAGRRALIGEDTESPVGRNRPAALDKGAKCVPFANPLSVWTPHPPGESARCFRLIRSGERVTGVRSVPIWDHVRGSHRDLPHRHLPKPRSGGLSQEPDRGARGLAQLESRIAQQQLSGFVRAGRSTGHFNSDRRDRLNTLAAARRVRRDGVRLPAAGRACFRSDRIPS